jgi:transposase InsO family protein
MIEQSKLHISHLCNNLGLNKSTYYNWKNNKEVTNSDNHLRELIKKIALEFPFYGYRRITKELQIRGFNVNHKRVIKIMREEKIICRRKKRFRPVTTQSNHSYEVYPNLAKDLIVTGLNQLWIADITYVHLPYDFVYLAIINDVFSRKCIGWNLSRDIDTLLTLGALNRAVASRKHMNLSKLIHHSDQGVQYAADDYVQRLNEFGIKISMSRKGNVYDNAFAESFVKTIKVEEVYINDYETFEDALKNIRHFIEKVYNAKRLHSGIGYKSPNKFESEVLNINLT